MLIKQNKRLTNTDFEMLTGTDMFQQMLRNSLTITWHDGEDEPVYAIIDWLENHAIDFFYVAITGVGAKKLYFLNPVDFDNILKLHQNMPVSSLKVVK